MKNDSHAHRAYTAQEIARWITRYRDSDLGLGAFAEQHGLAPSRLRYWVYDKRYAHSGQPSAAPPVFQEFKLATGLALPNWAVEISLPAGPVVRFSAAATPVLMSAVVQALRRPC